MNDGWKLLLQICGVVIAVWLFALSIMFGGIAVVVIAILVFGWKYLFGKNIFDSNDSNQDVDIENSKVIIQCPKCSQKLRVPNNKKIEISCKSCQHKWVAKI
jgi:Zn finger protein HypA/HybF involved in hydrogenase expression